MKNKKMSIDDIKKYIYNGEDKEFGDLALGLYLMFDYLDEKTVIDRNSFEQLFWDRILRLTNRSIKQ